MDARTSLAIWLRTGRAQKGLSLDDVARITKIQPRILERLEAGKHDGLPADVFVRGFVRSFAKCVGLDEDEALNRYGQCDVRDPSAIATPATVAARVVADMMTAGEPAMLNDGFAAGSLQNLPIASEEPALEEAAPIEVAAESSAPIVEAAADEPVVEAPVVEAPVVDLPSAPLRGAARPGETAPCEAPVVMAPPPDMDLTAAESPATVAAPKKTKRARRTSAAAATTPAPKKSRKRKTIATGTPSDPTPVVAAPEVTEESATVTVELVPATVLEPVVAEPVVATEDEVVSSDALAFASFAAIPVTEPVTAPSELEPQPEIDAAPWAAVEELPPPDSAIAFDVTDVHVDAGTWQPKMPPPITTATVPWALNRPARATPMPSLVAVIDDADPDRAEHAFEERRRSTKERRTFLPPILLDREDRSQRQGGLTLAVIILLIAATLTLSYLMRRPSSSGDGVTRADGSASAELTG